jgi:gamma-glutamyltranspeptidase
VLASQSAPAVLRKGGNVLEVMIAAAFAAVYLRMNSIGSDPRGDCAAARYKNNNKNKYL